MTIALSLNYFQVSQYSMAKILQIFKIRNCHNLKYPWIWPFCTITKFSNFNLRFWCSGIVMSKNCLLRHRSKIFSFTSIETYKKTFADDIWFSREWKHIWFSGDNEILFLCFVNEIHVLFMKQLSALACNLGTTFQECEVVYHQVFFFFSWRSYLTDTNWILR